MKKESLVATLAALGIILGAAYSQPFVGFVESGFPFTHE